MSDEARERLVQSFSSAVNAGELERALEMLAPDVRWHRPPDVPITGTLEGTEQVGKMWRAFMGSLERFEVVLGRFEHGGDRVLATVTFRGGGDRGDFEFSGAQVFTVRDGLIAEVHEFRSLPEARELLSSATG